MKELKIQLLTEKEHEDYKRFCGLTEEALGAADPGPCLFCNAFVNCLVAHTTPALEEFVRAAAVVKRVG